MIESFSYNIFHRNYVTPFKFKLININRPQITSDYLGINFIKSIFSNNVEEGFIHAYTEYNKALELFEHKKKEIFKPCIFKCVIPKGTYYYEGSCGEIACRKLIYNSIVKEINIKYSDYEIHHVNNLFFGFNHNLEC